jgi:hypothetical protein
MSHVSEQNRLAPASSHLSPSRRKAMLRRIEADLAQMQRCQQGDHQLEATRSPGVFVCHLCRTVGVCLWCGLTPPAGACLTVCPGHRDLVEWQASHPQGGPE